MIKQVEAVYEEMVEIRRWLHQHPEVSFQLDETCAYVKSKLLDYGLEVQEQYGKSSLVVDILGGSGKTIALRADMDALTLKEENDVPYKSLADDKMHACGHDGHTAMLLGAAKILSENRDQIPGNVRLIFQASEEGPESGAKAMIQDGVLDNIDEIFGLHLSTKENTGLVEISEGAFMASCDDFNILFKGKGGHASLPHESLDALAMAIKFVNDSQYIITKGIDPLEPVVISVGTFNAGSSPNIIPETARLGGTVRTCSIEVRNKVLKELEELALKTAELCGGTCTFELEAGLPPLINHKDMASKSIASIQKALPEVEILMAKKPTMGAEDFSLYVNEIPGNFMFVGARNEEKGLVHLMHNPNFDFDEEALKIGTKILLQHVLDM